MMRESGIFEILKRGWNIGPGRVEVARIVKDVVDEEATGQVLGDEGLREMSKFKRW